MLSGRTGLLMKHRALTAPSLPVATTENREGSSNGRPQIQINTRRGTSGSHYTTYILQLECTQCIAMYT